MCLVRAASNKDCVKIMPFQSPMMIENAKIWPFVMDFMVVTNRLPISKVYGHGLLSSFVKLGIFSYEGLQTFEL